MRIVRDYVHLGSSIQASGALGFEVDRRSHDALVVYLALAKLVFGAREISTRTRVSLAKSLILSKLIYGAVAWRELTLAQMAKLEAVMMRVYRMIAAEFRGSECHCKTDMQLREALGVSSVEVQNKKRRLCYVAGVAPATPMTLRALLQNHGGQLFGKDGRQ